ncbi:MAG TPA: 1-(5-phosphoribosyl)-5-[(5-phosphoribosylamino)methylideneamino] imidazole-4-carboxamide isomerase [Candidatus Aquilonibacter sp.]|nr:1-(5-phosphoribosyl)-5-[(5-phosphoribosylamino)methylideneamino] imidazole-4-carboxamide isomerase [Candidatus Aquilonibacter sp.]
MLIPSIDLMGGRIVQLVQGERTALEFSDFEEWIARFSNFPLVQLIDLDAAIGTGNNRELVREFTKSLPCQVGGGIRSIQAAEETLNAGARRVILGSSLIRGGKLDWEFAREISRAIGLDKLVFAVDSKNGHVAVRGWRELTPITALEMISALESWCAAFLYTHIDTEGLMQGIPMGTVGRLRASTRNQLIVAGGIGSSEQVDELDRMGIDAVVGMAIYSGKMKLDGHARRRPDRPAG